MESFEIARLNQGEQLLVKAETAPESLTESQILFRGFRATRESDHDIEGGSELIENEPSILGIRSGDADGVLRAGDRLEISWDCDHPDSKGSWNIQFGPKFHPLTTSRIVDIELVSTEE